jgi:Mn2+/Fe2+ NRAMP family transporter
MLAATAILLHDLPRSFAGRAYVALMFAYGIVNCVQDAWTEQVVKRGWTGRTIPNALEPRLNAIWLVILLIAAVAYLVPRRTAEQAPPAIIAA